MTENQGMQKFWSKQAKLADAYGLYEVADSYRKTAAKFTEVHPSTNTAPPIDMTQDFEGRN